MTSDPDDPASESRRSISPYFIMSRIEERECALLLRKDMEVA
jgi:hypothetical protein